MNIKEALEEFNFFNEGDYITKNMSIAKDVVLTAYEKEKGENVKLRLQDIPFIEGELKANKDRVNELKQELEKEKEKNKKAIERIEYYLVENMRLNDFDERNKELKKLEKILEE